ncbi:MAG: hypothetical protein JNJ59_07915 [Deltaproteobacteria bacterium]|nr:hypothetical protein [Deltaproteobacteria bacterium]
MKGAPRHDLRARLRHFVAQLAVFGAVTTGLGLEARSHCEDAPAAAVNARANPDDPSTQLVEAVWARVYGAFSALSGRPTELVVLGESARKSNGQPFPATAFICPSKPGETPRLYVTWPLITRAQTDKLYDLDFVALVIGHELGHRARDLTFEGQRDTSQGGPEIEARADAHGAFFAAVAGYSTRRLACDAALDTFLDIEAHVAEGVRAGRRQKLGEALKAFDVYESLYDASAGLAFWDSQSAMILLKWVDERLGRELTPIPEFKVLLALTILLDTASVAPWTKLAVVPGAPVNQLRCVPVFPQHTALWDEIVNADDGSQKGVNGSRDLGGDLKTAIGLLNDALGLGASPLAAYSGLACAHAYLGDTKKARGALEKAKGYLAGRPPSVAAALGANGTFFDWLDWMQQNKAPKAEAAEPDKKAWADKVRAQKASWSANASIVGWVDGLARYPTAAPEAKAAPIMCKAELPKSAPGEGFVRLPTCPEAPRAGGCPCGWIELHRLEETLTSTDPNDGIRTCVPGGWGTGLRWVDVLLPLLDLRSRMMVLDTVSGPLANLRVWEKGCKAFEARGSSDRGLTVYAGVCPALGAPQVILQADDCRVRRAIVIAL